MHKTEHTVHSMPVHFALPVWTGRMVIVGKTFFTVHVGTDCWFKIDLKFWTHHSTQQKIGHNIHNLHSCEHLIIMYTCGKWSPVACGEVLQGKGLICYEKSVWHVITVLQMWILFPSRGMCCLVLHRLPKHVWECLWKES